MEPDRGSSATIPQVRRSKIRESLGDDTDQKVGIIEKGRRRPISHYEMSVRKNRELFIKTVKPEYIESIAFHKPGSADMIEPFKGGLRRAEGPGKSCRL